MSSGLTYKFSGSVFSVQTGITGTSPSPSITGVSLTNPIIVSTAPQAHGLVSGDVAKVYGITTGPTNMNNKLYAVDDYTTNDFSLALEDGTGNTAWSVGGKIDKVAFSSFCELDSVSQTDGGADQHEVSTICSTFKEFVQGLSDSGTLQLDYNYAPSSTIQIAMAAAKQAATPTAFKVVLPNSGGTAIFIGTIETLSRNGSVSGVVWRGSASIKLSGPVFEL